MRKGVKVEKSFEHMIDRYVFDFKRCTVKNGWAQFDTSQDAYYYGIWVNPFKLKIVTYAEGDIIISSCEDTSAFVQELKRMKNCHNKEEKRGFRGIDCGCGDKSKELRKKFTELALDSMLH